jgi:hypothetical protein
LTIFLEITNQILRKEFQTIILKSKAADTSICNKLLTGLGAFLTVVTECTIKLGRDKDLAEKKRKIVENHSKQLASNGSIEEQPGDQAILEATHKFLKDCAMDAEKESTQHKHKEINIRKEMDALTILIRRIYEKLLEIDLLDVPYDEDVLNIFRYHMASYLIMKIEDDWRLENTNPLSPEAIANKLINSPQLTRNLALRAEKEALVKKALKDAVIELKRLDEQNPDYLEAKATFMLRFLKELMEHNKTLCKQFGIPIPIKVKMQFFSSQTEAAAEASSDTIGASVADLYDCCVTAFDEIRSLSVMVEPEAGFVCD